MIPIFKRVEADDYAIIMGRANEGLQLELRGKHIDELRFLLAKALNTTPYKEAPEWANELLECLEVR